jgi:hypothetical protein
MRLQGFWYGLPFLLLAALGLVAGVALLFLRGDLTDDDEFVRVRLTDEGEHHVGSNNRPPTEA